MEFRTVGAERAIEWYKASFGLFQRNPGLLIAMTLVVMFVIAGFELLLGSTPLGGMLAGALRVYLFAGLLYGLRELDQGRELKFEQLFIGFQGPLLVALGHLAVLIAVVALFGYFLERGGVGGWFLSMLLALAVNAAMFFAVPRVLFDRIAPMPALQASVQALLANIVPVFVYIAIAFVLLLIGTLLLLVGLLVAVPVVAGAQYRAYVEVWGDGGAAAMGPPSPPPGPPVPPNV